MHDDLVVRDGGEIGWAVRKDCPGLRAAIEGFYAQSRLRAGYDYRLTQLLRRIKQIQDPTRSADWKRFQQLQALFVRYGERYDFDPLMLTAQGYQESALDQSAKSHVGAIGVMQIMPATGAEVHGVLWRLSPRDAAGLDAYEAVDAGLYDRRELPVTMDANRHVALVYVARRAAPGRPLPGYMEAVLAAARDWRLPSGHVQALARWLPAHRRREMADDAG